MQDGASAHTSKYTTAYLKYLGVTTIKWPAYSPDLNPIEMVWSFMKDYIAQKYPDPPFGQQYKLEELRNQVLEAWEAVTPEFLKKLIDSMRDRCRAVISARGGHTKY